MQFETDKNTMASSFKHNWLVDILLKQLTGMPCMLFPALPSYQLMQTQGSRIKFFKIQISVLNRTNSHTKVDNQLPLLSLYILGKIFSNNKQKLIFDRITMFWIGGRESRARESFIELGEFLITPCEDKKFKRLYEYCYFLR